MIIIQLKEMWRHNLNWRLKGENKVVQYRQNERFDDEVSLTYNMLDN